MTTEENKKFLIILILLFLISPVFAKTTQCIKKYQVNGVEIDASVGNAELLVSYIIFENK